MDSGALSSKGAPVPATPLPRAISSVENKVGWAWFPSSSASCFSKVHKCNTERGSSTLHLNPYIRLHPHSRLNSEFPWANQGSKES